MAQTECIVRGLGHKFVFFKHRFGEICYDIEQRHVNSDKVRHKPGSATTCGLRLQISDQEGDFTNYAAKTKALISFAFNDEYSFYLCPLGKRNYLCVQLQCCDYIKTDNWPIVSRK